MVRIRLFEERVLADYLARKVQGFTHLYIGQEAVATGVCAALRATDYVTSTHRGHGHAIAKGVPMGSIMAELYAKSTGTCGGRGGSMHIADFSVGMLGANGIVGGGFGIAAGAALSSVLRGTDDVAVTFFGDGAINKGTFHEAANFAGLQKLPVIFACENNRYAQYTAIERTTAISDLETRAASYNMPGLRIDGNDVTAVYTVSCNAVQRARGGEGPTLLCFDTYRFQGHVVGDPEAYRTKQEITEHMVRDPITRVREQLLHTGMFSESDAEQITHQALSEVEEAVAFAASSPEPDPSTALDDVFTPDLIAT